MAAFSRKHAAFMSKFLTNWNVKRYPVIVAVRNSVYAPRFLEPTPSKEKLLEPLAEDDPRRFQPIKAAKTEQTTSAFYDPLVHKFINMLMVRGKKMVVNDIMEKTLENLKRIQIEQYHKAPDKEKLDIELDPVKIFYQAVENCKPKLITTKIMRGGVRYHVPIPCPPNYSRFKAMKWIIENCRDQRGKLPLQDKLAWEILDAYKNEGKSVRNKQDLHRLCENNRAYAHYRW